MPNRIEELEQELEGAWDLVSRYAAAASPGAISTLASDRDRWLRRAGRSRDADAALIVAEAEEERCDAATQEILAWFRQEGLTATHEACLDQQRRLREAQEAGMVALRSRQEAVQEVLAQARQRHELRKLEESETESDVLIPGTSPSDPWAETFSMMGGPVGYRHVCLPGDRVVHLMTWCSPDALIEQVRAVLSGGEGCDFFRILGMQDRYNTEEEARKALLTRRPDKSLDDFQRWSPLLEHESLVIVDTFDGCKVRGWITAFRYAYNEHPATIGFLPLEKGTDTTIPWVAIARVHRMADREIAKARREGYPITLDERIRKLVATEKSPT